MESTTQPTQNGSKRIELLFGEDGEITNSDFLRCNLTVKNSSGVEFDKCGFLASSEVQTPSEPDFDVDEFVS